MAIWLNCPRSYERSQLILPGLLQGWYGVLCWQMRQYGSRGKATAVGLSEAANARQLQQGCVAGQLQASYRAAVTG